MYLPFAFLILVQPLSVEAKSKLRENEVSSLPAPARTLTGRYLEKNVAPVRKTEKSSVGKSKLEEIFNEIESTVMDEHIHDSPDSVIGCKETGDNPNFKDNGFADTLLAVCDDVPKEVVKNALSLGAGILGALLDPTGGILSALAGGVIISAFDLSCAGESIADSLKGYTHTVLDPKLVRLVKSELDGLIQTIEGYDKIDLRFLRSWADRANTAEEKALSIGLNGLQTMASAASLKFRLLAWARYFAEEVSSKSDECLNAVGEIESVIVSQLENTRNRFLKQKEDFNTYKDNTKPKVETSWLYTKCRKCTYVFFCYDYTSSLVYASFKLADGTETKKSFLQCEGVHDAATKWVNLKKREIFDEMQAALWTPEVTYFERRVDCMLAKKKQGVQCSLPKYSKMPVGQPCDDNDFETRTIKNEAECREASLYFGYSFNKAFPVSSSPVYGCFYRLHDKNVLFESWKKDDPNNDWSKVPKNVNALCYGGGNEY